MAAGDVARRATLLTALAAIVLAGLRWFPCLLLGHRPGPGLSARGPGRFLPKCGRCGRDWEPATGGWWHGPRE